MKLLTADKMRELEKRADASGNSYAAMMERAGTLTARAIIERWDVDGRPVLVLVGPGNNGGDGLVCARALHDAGASVRLYLWKREPDDGDQNWRLCKERNIEFTRAEEDEAFGRLKQECARADILVDAFLGTGVARPIEGLLKQVLESAAEALRARRTAEPALVSPAFPTSRESEFPVVAAVDLPTGLNPDTGGLDPAAIPAALTVTFAFPKVGQYAFPGAGTVGELVVADIGIRPEWADDVELEVMTGPELRALLPARPRDSNKGTFGRALLACGSTEFIGAPRLAARGAGRVGAGLVTLAAPRAIYPILAAGLNEATYLPLPDVDGAWSPRAVRPLVEHARDYEALLVGCGFGRAASTRHFVARLLGLAAGRYEQQLPSLVLDADGLNALAEVKGWWKQIKLVAPPILTPHPGEMARLAGTTIAEVQRDRVATAAHYARAWNAVLVLKGAFTVIAEPSGRATLIPFATPALATAGTGDVLAGAIVGLLAQYRAASLKSDKADAPTAREDAYRAAIGGAYLHGLAGELAAAEIGEAGPVAGDLVPLLPEALRLVHSN